jgi:uncharacterized protein YuzE
MIHWTFDAGYSPESSQAYIYLTDTIKDGMVVESVELGDLAAEAGVKALHSLVLDFDNEGRLVGIELPGCATAVLPRALLAERGFDESRYRRRPVD